MNSKGLFALQVFFIVLCGALVFDELSLAHPRGWIVAINVAAIAINAYGAFINAGMDL